MSQTRRLAAILAADVAGYSRLMGADEEGTLERLKALRRELLDPKIAEHHGRIVKTTGDGLLVEFASVVDAVRCAVAVQQAMPERNTGVAANDRIELRIGINLGDVIVEGDDLYGDGVNIAARLEGLAEPGGICISEDAFRQVRGKIEAEFADIGEQSLKNIARPVRVYRVRDLDATVKSPATSALPLPDKPSIAVLPFANLSGDPEQEYFVDGMVEEIITALSRIRWLFVIARNSSFTYKGQAVDVKQVGRELGVRYVLEGSVRKSGQRVRITGQLIDAGTGAHLWADRFDGLLDDIFELQDQVASSVVGAIEPKLRQSETERATRKLTASLDAYDLYLRAVAQFHSYTEEGMREAIGLSKRALAIDQSYAPAAALISLCRMHQRQQGWEPISEPDVAEAVRFARQSIEEGKDDPDTLWMAGITLWFLAGEINIAESVIDRALALNPNSAHAWNARGWVSSFQNRPNRGIEYLQHAMRLSPFDPLSWMFTSGLAVSYFIARRFEEANEWADRSVLDQPRFGMALRMKAVLCAYLDRLEEAREWLRRALELRPDLTVATWKTLAGAVAISPEVLDLYLGGLRKAGLPEE